MALGESESPSVIVMKEFQSGQTAFDQGLWNEALHHFDTAQHLAPLQPDVYFNLGTSFRKSTSPLLAVLWLHAYLEAVPDTPDHDSIQSEIKRLEALADSKAQDLARLAASSVSKFPEEFAEEKESALKTLASIQGAAGRTREAQQIFPVSDPVAYSLQFGEYLAASHDYTTLEELLNSFQNKEATQPLLILLAQYQLGRLEKDSALKTLQRLPASVERSKLLIQLCALLTRELETDKAAALLSLIEDKASQDSFRALLLTGLLKAGKTDQARSLADQILKESSNPAQTQIARLVNGQGNQVLKEMKNTNTSAPGSISSLAADLYTFTTAAAWIGNQELADQGCRELESLAHRNDGKLISPFAPMACAYSAAEQNHFEQVLARLQTLDPTSEAEFSASLFWRLALKNQVEQLAQLVQVIRNPSATASLQLKLARLYFLSGNSDQASELLQKCFEGAVVSSTAYVLRNLGELAAEIGNPDLAEKSFKTERVLHWIFLARNYQNKETITDLGSYLDKNKSDDLRILASALTQAAGDWTSAVTLIRGTEKRHAHD